MNSPLKDSGVEWLGRIPAHWEIRRLALCFREVARPGNDDLPVLSISIHDGISDDELDADERKRKVTHIEDRSKYKRVLPGDLAYNMMRAWQGGLGAVNVEGQVSPAYVVSEPKVPLDTRYIELLLRTPMAIEEMRRFSRGIADFRSRLYWEQFRDLRVCLPPVKEQEAILREVTKATDRIDALIAKKNHFIALLREKRLALITRAVTKGLDPSVPMKDSGLEWIGDAPASWSTKRLRYVCDITTGGRDTAHANPNGMYPFYVRSQEVARIDSYSVECEAVLTAGDGAGVGKVYHYATGKFDFHQRVYMMHNFRHVTGRFFFYYVSALFAAVALDGGAKSTVDSLRMPVFQNFQITIPSPSEQQEIVKFIEASSSRIDALMSKTERSIDLLREHRTALITAAVTGKLNVPEAA